VFGDDPLQFGSGNIERFIPGQFDEFVVTS
jgi:hypothetical protein